MFCRFRDAFGTSPDLEKGKVYWLEFVNIGHRGVFGVKAPQKYDRGVEPDTEWKGVYTSYEQFLEDWEVL